MGLQPIKPWMAEKAHSTVATVRIYANVNTEMETVFTGVDYFGFPEIFRLEGE
jgi:hypothetical protein